MYSIKLKRSLYTLKQFKRMWYNRLSEYLLKKRISEQSNLPMCFYQEIKNWLTIRAVYMDDLNLIGNFEELTKIVNYLKKEFEMKDLRKTKYCLYLQIEHCSNGILVHQSIYMKTILKQFYMVNYIHSIFPWSFIHLK